MVALSRCGSRLLRIGRSRSSRASGRTGPRPASSPRVRSRRTFGFLTTDANAEVGTIHPKAMPVILTREGELDTWLAAPWPEAARLQRPLPDGSLRIVARSEKDDTPTAA
jgi:putative SOS response-associated peptidase YedK